MDADVVIVGSGVAGSIPAAHLARAGASVLVLESGPRVDRDQATRAFRANPIKTPDAPYAFLPYAPRPDVIGLNPYYVQAGPDVFKSTYERRVGGTTWHWLGSTPRMIPSDFEMQSRFGIAMDWPISYRDLEPWYGRAEEEMGVAGDADADLLAPRTTAYPMEAHPQSFLDGVIDAVARPMGLPVVPTPQARNSDSRNGKTQCKGNASCIPICPIGAKYDATRHVAQAESAGARVVANAVVYRVETGADGLVTAVRFKRPDGSEDVATGRVFILAAHAIETVKILLMSGSVANSSDQVGRNLMDHPIQLSWALTPGSVFPQRGPLSTSGIEITRDGPERAQRSAFRVEIANDGWRFPVGDPITEAPGFIERGLGGAALQEEFTRHMEREIRFASLTEDLPNPESRVTLASETDALGLPRPKIAYHVSQYVRDGMLAARDVHERLFAGLGATERNHRVEYEGAGHLMGTYRMGNDPATSVVDADQRSHDHANLFLLGSGVFPTVGTANPTLTLAALALRATPAIRETMRSVQAAAVPA